MVNHFHFKNLLQTWEGLNEHMFSKELQIANENMGGKRGPHMVYYRNLIDIDSCSLDPEFDFGTILGYRMQKWTSLVNNYVDLNKLDILKGNVSTRINRKTSNFNESMTFDNFHGSGKGCLLNLTCSRRYESKKDIVSFVLRSSEITRRLLFDLLLVQRMVEYIYGDRAKEVSIEMSCGHMYQNAEAFSLYHNHKNLRKLSKKLNIDNSDWSKRCMEVFKFMETTHPDKIKFRAHKRSAEALQRFTGEIEGLQSMKAKTLKIK